MKATALDFRRRMSKILHALDHNETVTIFYRGKKKGILYPAGGPKDKGMKVSDHPAFSMWKDRKDMQEVEKVVRDMRKGRPHAV